MDALGTLNAALSGRYEIQREIGAGGMATVYLARDIRHDRRVAVKVLKPELGAVLGVERFLTEIRVTANLQHPNLLPLFDSGEADGLLFYVMPFVDGETLRNRLEREKQLPIAEAIHIAVAVAGALDYAHRHDVIHRDLKPDNILMHAGQPVIADFGIALAVTNAAGARMTQSGLSLGTPQYMSPEQTTADRQIDGRTDIYSLATVLYEMLAGDPPFTASTVQAVIAKVIVDHPASVRALRPAVPEYVASALEKALEKLPADRWPTAAAFAEALSGIRALPSSASSSVSPLSPAASAPIVAARMPGIAWRRRMVRALPWLIAAVAIAAAAARMTRGSPGAFDGEPLRFTVAVPGHLTLPIFTAIAPDGRRLAFVTTDSSGRSLLYVRSLATLETRVINGTDDAAHPFWSPDSRWIGFFAFGKLKKVRAGGGPVETLAERTFRTGGTWSQHDTILFVTDAQGSMAKISATGGSVVAVPVRDSVRQPLHVVWPRFLPDGRHFLFFGEAAGARRGVYVASLDDAASMFVLRSNYRAVYASQGYLFYMHDDRSLMAQPFDVRRFQLTGAAVPVAGDVYGVNVAAHNNVSVSSNGVLAFVDRAATRPQLAWVDHHGGRVGAAAPVGEFQGKRPQLSPDGRQLAIAQGPFNEEDVWVYNVGAVQPARRLTFDGAANATPLWSRDGRQIVFESGRGDQRKVYRLPASGGGTRELVLDPAFGPKAITVELQDMSADSRFLVFSVTTSGNRATLWVVPLGGDRTPFLFVKGDFDNSQAVVSPDGHWLAYTSNETGRNEVYVQSFPPPGHKQAISVNGGVQPRWQGDGKELYYLASNQQIISVPIRSGTNIEVGSATVLFRADLPNWGAGNSGWRTSYDVAPDGSRFVLAIPPEKDVAPIVVVVNWPALVKR